MRITFTALNYLLPKFYVPPKFPIHCCFRNSFGEVILDNFQSTQMARIQTTAKLITPTSSKARQDTMSISEAMRASSSSRPAPELPKDRPSKPSYIEIVGSTLREKDLQSMKKLGYFRSKVNVRLPRNEASPMLGKDKVVVYKSFFKAGLQLRM